MTSELHPAQQSLLPLSEQFERLLLFLRRTDEEWLQSRCNELSGLPDELGVEVGKLAAVVAGLRCQLQGSGHKTVREWLQSGFHAGHEDEKDPTASLREKIRQARDVVQIQQLLAKNLLAYARGIALLTEFKQQPVYTNTNSGEASDRGQRVQLRA